MKLVAAFALVGLLATLASARSLLDIDPARVKSIEEYDRYWRRLPAELQYLRHANGSSIQIKLILAIKLIE